MNISEEGCSNVDHFLKKAKETWADPDGEELIAWMDDTGIEFTIICGVDILEDKELTPEVVQAQNKTIAHIAKKHPDRVAALAGVNPFRDNAVDIVAEFME